METIELQIDKETLEHARRLAQSRRCSLEELLKEIIEHVGMAERVSDEQDWARLTAEQFLKGYTEGD